MLPKYIYLIKDFIKSMKKTFPKLEIDYKYHDKDSCYEIYYTEKKYKYDDDFKFTSGKLINIYFFDNNFYDFYFDYKTPEEQDQKD